jgi:hypothetical protein
MNTNPASLSFAQQIEQTEIQAWLDLDSVNTFLESKLNGWLPNSRQGRREGHAQHGDEWAMFLVGDAGI